GMRSPFLASRFYHVRHQARKDDMLAADVRWMHLVVGALGALRPRPVGYPHYDLVAISWRMDEHRLPRVSNGAILPSPS
ncbi:MAG: hypothetical protein J7M34_01970, partial [Anaerolineae bacterium]|nr:hypothetical protein [Anaerolineae bacterium]